MKNDPFAVDAGRLAEIGLKRARIAGLLAEKGFEAIVISRHDNIAWATAGVVDVRVGMLREIGAASLLITREGAAHYLTTNNEALRLAEEEFDGLGFEPHVNPWHANDLRATAARVAGSGAIVGDMGQEGLQPLAIQSLRYELTNGEVDRYRWLGARAARTAVDVLSRFKPGMEERTLHAMLAERLIDAAIVPSVYLTATDARIAQYPHPVPRSGVLERLGMLGFCARRWGLSVSLTRFVHFGAPPAELEEMFSMLAQTGAQLVGATRAGVTSSELFGVAQQAYSALGHPGAEQHHHQGGATGYLEREWLARPGGAERVTAQQAFAWNPNLHGAKVEDTFLLRDGKMELLTGTAELPAIAAAWNGTEYRFAGLLRM
ncbi:MAG TPA: M24 family metallopeptidase [Terracidiphilus sp.]|jgi:antitoxin VapB|nr:M24 family metallopeptidase [Terracidiphilus sp.]